MPEQKEKLTVGMVAGLLTIGGLIFATGSILVWIWNGGEVQASCNYYNNGGRMALYCRTGSTEDIAFWDMIYGYMWKIGITLAIIVIVAAIAAMFA